MDLVFSASDFSNKLSLFSGPLDFGYELQFGWRDIAGNVFGHLEHEIGSEHISYLIMEKRSYVIIISLQNI